MAKLSSSVSISAIYSWQQQLTQQLLAGRHRSVVFLLGDLNWAKNWLLQAEPNWQTWVNSADAYCVFSECKQVAGSVNSKTYRHHLGTENSKIAFFDKSFNVDAFAALSGTLVAGGVLYCWLDKITLNSSYFIQHLVQTAKFEERVYVIDSDDDSLPELPHSSPLNAQPFSLPTQGQKSAISAIVKLANGRANSAFVLTADRGRGKSTSLALAAVQLLEQSDSPLKIVITAPHRMAVSVFFEHAKQQLNELKLGEVKCVENTIIWMQHKIQFIAVDTLVKQQEEVNLLLIDEAAGIPVYLLELLTRNYPRIVFSSTVHGYEGAGKGFTAKFLGVLHQLKKRVGSQHLDQAIRWNDSDPLERFTFASCLLDAKYDEFDNAVALSKEHIKLSVCSGKTLFENPSLLNAVFAVLVTAHYQTKPSDLKLLLDDENIRIVVAQIDEHVVAVALIIREGDINDDLKSQIYSGQRRIKGHLVAQSLAQQSILSTALEHRYLRVMRIAVHPKLQAQGIGTLLLEHIKKIAENDQIDFIATSFAASTAVVNFWQKNDFIPVKLGFNKDASSGEHSLIMLSLLNKEGESFLEQVQTEFFEQFSAWLQDEFSELSYSLVMQILSMAPSQHFIFSARDLEKVSAFKLNENLYSVARTSIAKWLLNSLAGEFKSELRHKLTPLVAKCLMLHNDQVICEHFNFTGKKALYQHFQQIITLDE